MPSRERGCKTCRACTRDPRGLHSSMRSDTCIQACSRCREWRLPSNMFLVGGIVKLGTSYTHLRSRRQAACSSLRKQNQRGILHSYFDSQASRFQRRKAREHQLGSDKSSQMDSYYIRCLLGVNRYPEGKVAVCLYRRLRIPCQTGSCDRLLHHRLKMYPIGIDHSLPVLPTLKGTRIRRDKVCTKLVLLQSKSRQGTVIEAQCGRTGNSDRHHNYRSRCGPHLVFFPGRTTCS